MPKVGLFAAIDSLWTKKRLEGMPSTFIMHRFLASEQALASVAKDLQSSIRDEEMRVEVWRGLLPKGRGGPRLRYVAPKKGPSAEELTTQMMRLLAESREVVEEMISFFELEGREEELYHHFGVEYLGEN